MAQASSRYPYANCRWAITTFAWRRPCLSCSGFARSEAFSAAIDSRRESAFDNAVSASPNHWDACRLSPVAHHGSGVRLLSGHRGRQSVPRLKTR